MANKQKDKEKRVSRLSVVMTPSLLEEFKILADVLHLSNNDLAVKIIAATVKKHSATIQSVKLARQAENFDSIAQDSSDVLKE